MSDSEICGVSYTGGTGIEWICINPPHDKAYLDKKGRVYFGSGGKYRPPGDRHYMVAKYPNSSREKP